MKPTRIDPCRASTPATAAVPGNRVHGCNLTDDDTGGRRASKPNSIKRVGVIETEGRDMNTSPKDTFDLWWEWAEKPLMLIFMMW